MQARWFVFYTRLYMKGILFLNKFFDSSTLTFSLHNALLNPMRKINILRYVCEVSLLYVNITSGYNKTNPIVQNMLQWLSIWCNISFESVLLDLLQPDVILNIKYNSIIGNLLYSRYRQIHIPYFMISCQSRIINLNHLRVYKHTHIHMISPFRDFLFITKLII